MSAMKQTRISQILLKLLALKQIKVTELARQIDVPQPTVHRIVNGVCEHPHISSLEPIANYFEISVDQLKGLDSIAWLDQTHKVPLLTWIEAVSWPRNRKQVKNRDTIHTDAKISPEAYGLTVDDASMDPVFPSGTVLIADPKKEPKDRSYVIVKLAKHAKPIFRQLVLDAGKTYLKPLSPMLNEYKLTCLSRNDLIISTVIQAKRNYDD